MPSHPAEKGSVDREQIDSNLETPTAAARDHSALYSLHAKESLNPGRVMLYRQGNQNRFTNNLRGS